MNEGEKEEAYEGEYEDDRKHAYVTEQDFANEFQPNVDFSHLAQNILNGNFTIFKFRRLYWGIMLGVLRSTDANVWKNELDKRRKEYKKLYEKHQIKPSTLTALDPQIFHPLSNSEHNPWIVQQKNDELLADIWKDIERTFPERALFQDESVRKSLQRILFVWCKENPDVCYKQGMNELLAVLYLVCTRDSYRGEENKTSVCYACCGSEYTEADVYTLFDTIMDTCMMKAMFLPAVVQQPANKGGASAAMKSPSRVNHFGVASPQTPQSAVLCRCGNIFHNILKNSLPAVYAHLQAMDVEPQLFLLRWIRLLFCREFHVEDTLIIWDAIFADAFLKKSFARVREKTSDPVKLGIQASAALPLTDYFAIAMVAFVRQHLLELDSSGCLRRLLKFPPLESVLPLVQVALQTRDSKAVSNTTPSFSSSSSPPNASSCVNSSSSSSCNISSPPPPPHPQSGSLACYSKRREEIPVVSTSSTSEHRSPHRFPYSSSSGGEIGKRNAACVGAAKPSPGGVGRDYFSGSGKTEHCDGPRLAKEDIKNMASSAGGPQRATESSLSSSAMSFHLTGIFERLSTAVASPDDQKLREEARAVLRDISTLNKTIRGELPYNKDMFGKAQASLPSVLPSVSSVNGKLSSSLPPSDSSFPTSNIITATVPSSVDIGVTNQATRPPAPPPPPPPTAINTEPLIDLDDSSAKKPHASFPPPDTKKNIFEDDADTHLRQKPISLKNEDNFKDSSRNSFPFQEDKNASALWMEDDETKTEEEKATDSVSHHKKEANGEDAKEANGEHFRGIKIIHT